MDGEGGAGYLTSMSGLWWPGSLTCSRVAHTRRRGRSGRLPPVLARRSLKIHWFRALVDGVIAGRAQLEEAWPPPPQTRQGVRCAGYPLLFRLQRVITRVIGDQPSHPVSK